MMKGDGRVREKKRPGRKKQTKFAVVGAGHGGLAMAGALALKGYEVNLFNKTFERIKFVKMAGGVHVSGAMEGFGKLAAITTDIAEAITDVNVIMVVIPAVGHKYVAEISAPHLADGQTVVLNPGRTGGAMEFSATLNRNGVKADVTVAEAQTFIFASRTTGPAQAHIYGIKHIVSVASLPAIKAEAVISLLRPVFPQYVKAENVLKTSFDNIGAIFHPAPTLLNSGRIEATAGNFDYYHEGITPAVASIIEEMDRERMAVARALGIEPLSAFEWLDAAYGATGATLYEAIQNNEGYKGLQAPATLQHRYIFEDVPASLVPIASIGEMLGVETKTIKSIISLASAVHGVDYWQTGRTVERLGIAGMKPEEIAAAVSNGLGFNR
jgi:opine dehydrogenase